MATNFRGIAFPFRKGKTSFPEVATGSDLIRQSIIQILLTGKGERVMRPDFGSAVSSLVFENNSAQLIAQAEAEVFSAIGRWEPRVIVRSVKIEKADGTSVAIRISYVESSTKTLDSVTLQLGTPQ